MPVSGKQGLVLYKGEAVDNINDYTGDVAVDMRDHTAFTTGAVFFRLTKPGLAGATATINGLYDVSSTDQDDMIEATLAGSTGNLRLELDKEDVSHGDFSGRTGINERCSRPGSKESRRCPAGRIGP